LNPRFDDSIVIENMVYGAFSYSRKGQQVVGKTSGISPATEKEIIEFCNSWGDCRNLKFRRSLNQFPLKSTSPYGQNLIAVVKVINTGRDQIGREGALVRHALVLTESDYRHLEFNPFTFESQGVFLTVWTRKSNCQTIFLDKSTMPPSDISEIPRKFFDSLFAYLHTVLSGGEIFLFSNNHIHTAEDITYYLMKILPLDIKAKIAMTTFAFRKNLDYKIGCYYRASSAVTDPLKIKFEMTGEKNSEAERFLNILFENLKSEKYGRVIKMITEPLPY
jgi:hypothetical protein